MGNFRQIIISLLVLLVHNATIYEGQSSTNSIVSYRLLVKQQNQKMVRDINSQRRGYTLEAYPQFAIYTIEELRQIGKNKEMSKFSIQGIQFKAKENQQYYQSPRQILRYKRSKIVNNTLPTGLVKSQGFCGGCYSFAGISVINFGVNTFFDPVINNNQYKMASQQQVMQCSYGQRNKGCDGGWPHNVFLYVRRNGVLTDAKYSLRNQTIRQKILKPCNVTQQTPKQMFIGNSPIKVSRNHDILTLMSIIDKFKVAAIGVSAADPRFKYYKSGILTDCGYRQDIDHAVVAVGYIIDHEKSQYAWIVKNSWGAQWGMYGHILISMQDNTCNALDYASYLDYKK